MGLLNWFESDASTKKRQTLPKRRLGIESLENRELLSVSLAEIPQPDYSSALVADQDYGSMAPAASVQTEAEITTITKLAAPKSVSKGTSVTPSTVTVNWLAPASTLGITHYELKIVDSATKNAVSATAVKVNVGDTLTWTFEGLQAKSRYEVQITSMGAPATTDSVKATLKISASTPAIALATVKAVKPGLTSTNVTITDKDKYIPFVDGKTVKTYEVQYAVKSTSPVWTTGAVIASGTTVSNATKGTIDTSISGLLPGTNYIFRVLTSYVDGVLKETILTSQGKNGSFKTVALPVPTIAKVAFTLVGGDIGVSVSGKQTKPELYTTAGTVKYSLYVSTSSTVNKATGRLDGAQRLTLSGEEIIGGAATFSMKSVSLTDIGGILDTASSSSMKLLNSTSITFQIVAEYFENDVLVQTVCSRASKFTLPKWYKPV